MIAGDPGAGKAIFCLYQGMEENVKHVNSAILWDCQLLSVKNPEGLQDLLDFKRRGQRILRR